MQVFLTVLKPFFQIINLYIYITIYQSIFLWFEFNPSHVSPVRVLDFRQKMKELKELFLQIVWHFFFLIFQSAVRVSFSRFYLVLSTYLNMYLESSLIYLSQCVSGVKSYLPISICIWSQVLSTYLNIYLESSLIYLSQFVSRVKSYLPISICIWSQELNEFNVEPIRK